MEKWEKALSLKVWTKKDLVCFFQLGWAWQLPSKAVCWLHDGKSQLCLGKGPGEASCPLQLQVCILDTECKVTLGDRLWLLLSPNPEELSSFGHEVRTLLDSQLILWVK